MPLKIARPVITFQFSANWGGRFERNWKAKVLAGVSFFSAEPNREKGSNQSLGSLRRSKLPRSEKPSEGGGGEKINVSFDRRPCVNFPKTFPSPPPPPPPPPPQRPFSESSANLAASKHRCHRCNINRFVLPFSIALWPFLWEDSCPC